MAAPLRPPITTPGTVPAPAPAPAPARPVSVEPWYRQIVPTAPGAVMPEIGQAVPLDVPQSFPCTVPAPRKPQAPAPTPTPVPAFAVRIRELFRSGIGLRSISDRMNKEGCLTPNGNPWTALAVIRTLQAYPVAMRRGRRPGPRVPA